MSRNNEPITDDVACLAHQHFGLPGIYPYQRGIIDEILMACTGAVPDGGDAPCGRSLILLPTGAGKSLCYMLPCLLLDTLTLILYPLNALIADQLNRFSAAGIPAAALTGGVSTTEKRDILAKAGRNELKALLINPETLLIPAIAAEIAALRPGHIVLDEAHTVAEWGLSFRPAYIEAAEMVRSLNPSRISAFTATATPELLPSIASLIFGSEGFSLVSRSPARDNIAFSVINVLSREAEIAGILRSEGFESPAIIFCRTRRETERIARCFRGRCGSSDIRFYHAGLERDDKQRLEAWFMQGGAKILCATCAFGLGVDCPGVRTVIHLSPPSSAEAYIQESGRAGRDGKPCRALVLLNTADLKIRAADRAQSSTEAERAAGRRHELRAAFTNETVCRRSSLMKLFNPQERVPACGICDVCQGLTPAEPAGLKQITSAVRHFCGVLSAGETADLLKGYAGPAVRMVEGEKSRFFGLLSEWDYEWIQAAIQELCRTMRIREGGPLSGRRLRPGCKERSTTRRLL